MNKIVLTIAAAVTLAALINSAQAQDIAQLECHLYPVDRYSQSWEQRQPLQDTVKSCVAKEYRVREEQVNIIAVNDDEDQILVTITFSASTLTLLVTEKEVRL